MAEEDSPTRAQLRQVIEGPLETPGISARRLRRFTESGEVPSATHLAPGVYERGELIPGAPDRAVMIHRLREAGKLPSGEVDFTLFTFGHDPVTLERLRDSAAVCLLNRLSDVGLELTPRTADAVSAGAADAARKIVRRAAGTALYELWRLELELGLRDGDSIRTIVESGFRQLFAGDASERELRKLYAMTGLRHVLSLTAEQVAVGIEACHPDLLNEAISKAELSTFRQARSAALRLVGPIKHEPRLTAIVQLVDDHRILQIAVLVALANQRKTD